MKRIALSLLAFLVAAQPALASNCFSGFCAPQRVIRYSAPKVVKRVQQAVVVQKEYPVINQQIFYPVGQPASLGYQALHQAQYGQANRQIERAVSKLKELQQYEQQYQQRSYQQQSYQAYAAPQQQPYYPQQQYAAPPQQQGEQCASCAEVLRALLGPKLQQQQQQNGYHQPQPQQQLPPQQGQQQSVIEARCLSCHSGEGAKGGLDFTRLAEMDFQTRHGAFKRAATGEMPPPTSGKPPLSSVELWDLFNETHSPEEAGELMNKQQAARTNDGTPPVENFNGAH